jgi:hypothetical protein
MNGGLGASWAPPQMHSVNSFDGSASTYGVIRYAPLQNLTTLPSLNAQYLRTTTTRQEMISLKVSIAAKSGSCRLFVGSRRLRWE